MKCPTSEMLVVPRTIEVEVDYKALMDAVEKARKQQGLSVVLPMRPKLRKETSSSERVLLRIKGI